MRVSSFLFLKFLHIYIIYCNCRTTFFYFLLFLIAIMTLRYKIVYKYSTLS